MGKIRVKQIRSVIGQSEKIRKVVYSMGFRKLNLVKEFKDNNCIRGMINKAKHLLSYELIDK